MFLEETTIKKKRKQTETKEKEPLFGDFDISFQSPPPPPSSDSIGMQSFEKWGRGSRFYFVNTESTPRVFPLFSLTTWQLLSFSVGSKLVPSG